MAKQDKTKDIGENELKNLDTILRGVNFLAQFSLSTLENLISCLKKVSRKKGTVVVREGDKGDSFYFISSGAVSVWIKKGPKKHCIKTLGSGEYFGEMALLVGGKRNATVIAEEDSVFFVLSKDDFRSMLIDNPSVMEIMVSTSEKRRSELTKEKEK